MKKKQLHTVANIIAGQSPPSSTYNTTGDGLPFFQGKADFQEKYPLVRIWCNSERRKEAVPGDILMSVRAPVGAVNICDQKSIIGRGLSAIRAKSELNSDFLYYFLKSNEQSIANLGTGSTFKAITQETLKKVEIPFPPLDDQKRIAHLLGKVEGLIAERKQHLQQLDDLLKSVFLEMFGDPVRNEKNFKISTLAQYITHLTSGGRGWAKYYAPSGKRFIRSLDVQMNAIGTDDVVYITPPNNKETDRTRVLPGDVLLTITGSKIGRVCFVPKDFEEAYISQHVAIIRTNGINPVYLSFYLSMPVCGQRTIVKQQYGQAKPGLNLTQIQNFEIIDPNINLQNQFAAIFEKVDGLKARYQQSLADLEALYGALSQRAFKGELELSRVILPLQTTKTAEEIEPTASEISEAEFLSNLYLPAPQDKYILHDAEGRLEVFGQWLNSYLEQPGRKPFSVEHFMECAQQRLWELLKDDAYQLGITEYDHIKSLLFQAIESGRLTQTYDDTNNRVQVTAVRGKMIREAASP